MDNRAIGVFDSGLGGLTAVKELQRLMPEEDIVYFGDTGRVPYGSRSRETIVKYAQQDAAFLKSKQVKMILAACGTVSSVAAEILERQELPVTGVLRPTALAAAAATKNGKIGIIGTTATIRSGSYRRELNQIDPSFSVFEQDCPLFVPLVENGFLEGDEVTRLVAERYLEPLKQEGVDTLIMGCTHYPIIRGVLCSVMGGGVRLIDSGSETALYASRYLKEHGLLHEPGHRGTSSFFVSDRTEGFSGIAGIFLGHNVKQDVTHIEIENY